MPSTSVSTMLLFIGAISAATVAAGTVVTGAQEVGAAVRQQGVDTASEIDTEIRIVNDPEGAMVTRAPSGTGGLAGDRVVHVLVKNVGGSELVARNDTIDVILDGNFVENASASSWDEGVVVHDSPDDRWDPGEVASVYVKPPSGTTGYQTGTGYHRVKVVVGDNSDGFTYG